MPRQLTSLELLNLTTVFASSTTLRLYKGNVYEARDYETGQPTSDPKKTRWLALTEDDYDEIRRLADVIFASPKEFYSFQYMIQQQATRMATAEPYVIIRHGDGLARLTDMGLEPVENPGFAVNFINHRVIDKEHKDYKHVEKLFATITEWLGSEAQAHSLLYHLATALQPGWAAVKYVLLLGEGRNGKGTLLAMLRKLLGPGNVSGVLRQDMARRRPTIMALNGKLANIVFDGPMQWVSDSGPEKTLTAGEPLDVEPKYSNTMATVETNALFIEALQKEPKARDKSAALQSRLVRFYFPNKYANNRAYAKYMLSDIVLDALLTLLWEHWVSEVDENLLALTAESESLQNEHTVATSPLLLFIEETEAKTPGFIERLTKDGLFEVAELQALVLDWMKGQTYEGRTASDVRDMITTHFECKSTGRRLVPGGPPVKRLRIIAAKATTQLVLDTYKNETAILEGMEE